jgi:hypothetical protein
VPVRDELIERVIRQLAAAFLRLTSRSADLEVGDVEAEELRAELDDVYRRFLGTSAELVSRLSTDDLLAVIGSAGYVDGERAYLLSALLETEAELEHALGAGADDPLVVSLRSRALDMALEAGIEELGEPDLPDRVERLLALAPAGSLSPATRERLVWFWLALRRYAHAEDALFDWLDEVEERGGDAADVGRVAGRLYADLELRDDAELAAGGLPRAELGEGRADVEARLGALRGA